MYKNGVVKMKTHTIIQIMLLQTVIVPLHLCVQIPPDPAQDPNKASVKLFAKDENNIIEYGIPKEFGLEITNGNHMDTVHIFCGCGNFDTLVFTDTTTYRDTIWFSTSFYQSGTCTLSVTATMKNTTLKEKKNDFPLYILAENPSLHFTPDQPSVTMFTGKTDTLVYILHATGKIPLTPSVTLTSVPEPVPTVFAIETDSLSDSVRIIMRPDSIGTYTLKLIASASAENVSLDDTAVTTVTIKESIAPSVVHAPHQLSAEKTDTLVFAVDNSSRETPLSIALLGDSVPDAGSFFVIPSGPDSIVIQVVPSANTRDVVFSIVTGDGTDNDTTLYPVTISGTDSDTTADSSSVPSGTDTTGPAIRQISGPGNAERVTTASGTLSYTISDKSGIDTVWWTLDGSPLEILKSVNDTFTISFTLTHFSNNSITVHARDRSSSKNEDSLSTILTYNTRPEPSTVSIASPHDAETGVSRQPVLRWNRIADADGDTLLYRVQYGTTPETLSAYFPQTSDTFCVVDNADILNPRTTYFWQVYAFTRSLCPDTVKSPVYSFTTAGVSVSISIQPLLTDSVFAGGSFSLSVTADGNPEPQYQWYRNDTTLPADTFATLSRTEVYSDDSGRYYVVVKNGAGPDKASDTVTVRIFTKTRITESPRNATVNEDETAEFTVSAIGDGPLQYQWLVNDTPAIGQTSAGLTISGVTPALDGNRYRCIVSNGFSRDTSLEAILTVTPTPVYTVKFGTDGGTPIDSQRIRSGNKASKPEANPTKNGYYFTGWFIAKNSSTPFDFDQIITASVTVYAQWRLRITWSVTFDDQSATTAPSFTSKTIDDGSELGILPTEPLKTGYFFDGWWTGRKGTGSHVFDTTKINSGFAVYAKWTIKDIDGNIYTDVTIGTQTWMAENFKATHYNDGIAIPNEFSEIYYWPDNDESNKEIYGALYTWKVTVKTNPRNIAPRGWRMPTDSDWVVLQQYLIMNGYNFNSNSPDNQIGKAMASKEFWNYYYENGTVGNSPNTNNSSGFSAVPAGYRNYRVEMDLSPFYDFGKSASFWSSDPTDPANTSSCKGFSLHYDSMSFYQEDADKGSGYSIRLIRDY